MPELREITPVELKAVLDAHVLWLESDGAQGERADLEFANLRGANLRGAILRGAILRSANLEDTNLRGASLRGAYLESANLRNASLVDTSLEGANLEGAVLVGANLSLANLRNANLKDADLEMAYLVSANLEGAYLESASLAGASLASSNLENAYLRNAILPKDHLILGENQNGLKQELHDAERRERKLKQELHTVSSKLEQASSSEEQATELQKQMEMLEADLKSAAQDAEDTRQKLEKAVEQSKALEEENELLTNSAVEGAAKIMLELANTAYSEKEKNDTLSKWLTGLSLGSYGVAILFILAFALFPAFRAAIGVVCNKDATFWSFIPLYLPVIVSLSIGTALFRHEGKIRNQTSFFMDQIASAEKSAGLLKVATRLEGVPDDNLKQIILPTFVDVRRSLLNMPGQTPSNDETDKLDIPSSTVDFAAKLAAKGLKSEGKS